MQTPLVQIVYSNTLQRNRFKILTWPLLSKIKNCNSEKMMAEIVFDYNRSITIENEDSYTIVKQNIDKLYALDSSIHQEHSLNVDITNSMYQTAFKEVFMLQPCTILASYLEDIIETDCQVFADGAIYQGMAVGLARYFENLRYITLTKQISHYMINTKNNFINKCFQDGVISISLQYQSNFHLFLQMVCKHYTMTIYDQFWNNSKANFTTIARGFTTFKNITKNSDNISNYILNLVNFNQSKEARVLKEYNKYLINNYSLIIHIEIQIVGTFRYLMEKLQTAISIDIDDAKTQRLALFIVFEVLLFVIYFMLWLPLVIKMTRDVWRTRSMIMMIPLRVIQKIRSIKQFIKDFLHAKELET